VVTAPDENGTARRTLPPGVWIPLLLAFVAVILTMVAL
jgi:hypothetical protein|tara:strand:- start:671 stop:784 length:114 start_codon:yes stop_codon:yes gene_type:complete